VGVGLRCDTAWRDRRDPNGTPESAEVEKDSRVGWFSVSHGTRLQLMQVNKTNLNKKGK